MAFSPTTRTYVASKFAIELDGEGVIGFLNSAEGGGLKTDIIDYKQGRFQDVWRQVGRVKFEDITLKVGFGLSTAFYAWVTDFFNRKLTRKNGAIVQADFDFKERSRRTFTDALITEVQIPALDSQSKDPLWMTVKLVAENMTYPPPPAEGQGARIAAADSRTQPNKMWHNSMFNFTVDGYEDSFRWVQKIDGFSIKQQILEYPSGHRRTPIRVPGRLEYPNITCYMPMSHAEKIIDQTNKRIMSYEAPPPGGMTGFIELRKPDKSPLCTISLSGVDIVAAEPQKAEASAESMAMAKITIQCEKMAFEYKA